ncbi:hypothetical protein QYS47_27990 (plasmid) [Marivirga arenosa]|nr:hypothetical protein QYS47_27990 [Marivirga sp. BKB1-2]
MESIEKDPYGLDQKNPDNEAEMKTFIETHSKGDVNVGGHVHGGSFKILLQYAAGRY